MNAPMSAMSQPLQRLGQFFGQERVDCRLIGFCCTDATDTRGHVQNAIAYLAADVEDSIFHGGAFHEFAFPFTKIEFGQIGLTFRQPTAFVRPTKPLSSLGYSLGPLIAHQRNPDFATSLPHTFCMDFTTFTFVR
jgi:hypothetical protein